VPLFCSTRCRPFGLGRVDYLQPTWHKDEQFGDALEVICYASRILFGLWRRGVCC
jgi:hypothetical protein